MGQDKALLPLPGNERTTFVAHLVSILTALCSEVLLVARDDAQAAAYTSLPGIRTIIDKVPFLRTDDLQATNFCALDGGIYVRSYKQYQYAFSQKHNCGQLIHNCTHLLM